MGADVALAVRITGRLSFSATGRQPVSVILVVAYAGRIATTSTKAPTLGYGGGLRRAGLCHQRVMSVPYLPIISSASAMRCRWTSETVAFCSGKWSWV